MTKPIDPVAIAQTILQGPWKHAAGARDACREARWPAFARSIAPPRPTLIGRLDHHHCLALAERPARGPETRTLTIVPLWACSTEVAVSTEWVAVHGVVASGEPMYVQETGPFIAVDDADPRVEGAIWVCTVNEWKAATVVESRSYAPGISLLLRAGAFGALEIAVDEVVSVDVQPSESRPRPTRQVPMFANWFEPRVTVTADLAKQIEAMCFTAPDEEST